MAVYKPSNLVPTLQEIDVLKDQVFSCQVNTSGEKVTKYKIQVLSNRGDILGNTELRTANVKNKGTLKANISADWFAEINSAENKKAILNGKDYQWNIRTYIDKVNTRVCEGYLVGSTKYVLWSQIPSPDSYGDKNSPYYIADETTRNTKKKELQDILDQIVYDRYVEFNVTTDSSGAPLVRGAKEDDDFTIPTNEQVRERLKISWVNKDLGTNKDYIKIECDDPFKYNYEDGTSYSIYQCSDKHTVNSVFADPNGEINQSDYIFIYKDEASAQQARLNGDSPSSDNIDVSLLSESMIKGYDEDNKPFYRARKITGYSSDTGEIRVIDSFYSPPLNGECYRLFSYNSSNNTYEAVDEDKVTDDNTKNDTHIKSHIIGGLPINNDYYKIVSNKVTGTSSLSRLFIQPNINIKTDDVDENANQIVFDDGTTIQIIKQKTNNPDTNKELDITFNKLDNTQWLLEGNAIRVKTVNTSLYDLIIPQQDYSVYSNFMDSMPNSIFYARKTPELIVNVSNYIDSGDIDYYEGQLNPDGSTILNYKDVEFDAELSSYFEPSIKYYQYSLYSGEEVDEDNLVVRSEEIYDNDLTWHYRGLESYADQSLLEKYIIHILIVDEYDTQFETSITFGVQYKINTGFVPLAATLECHEKAIQLCATAPIMCISTTGEEGITVSNDADDIVQLEDDNEIYHNYVHTGNKILNYTTIETLGTNITLPTEFTFNTQFRLTPTFVKPLMKVSEDEQVGNKQWEKGNEKEIFKIVNDDNEYKLTVTSLERFYKVDNDITDYENYPFDASDEDDSSKWENYSRDRWVENEEAFSFKLYKNGEAINCFSDDSNVDGTLWNIALRTNGLFKTPIHLKYALQEAQYYYIVASGGEPNKVDGVLKNVVFVDRNEYLEYIGDSTKESDEDTKTIGEKHFDKLKEYIGNNELVIAFYPILTIAKSDFSPIFQAFDANTNYDEALRHAKNISELPILDFIIVHKEIGDEPYNTGLEPVNWKRDSIRNDYLKLKYIFNALDLNNNYQVSTLAMTKTVSGVNYEQNLSDGSLKSCYDVTWNICYDDIYIVLDHLLQLSVKVDDDITEIDMEKQMDNLYMELDGKVYKIIAINKVIDAEGNANVLELSLRQQEVDNSAKWAAIAKQYEIIDCLYDGKYGHLKYMDSTKCSDNESEPCDNETNLVWLENNSETQFQNDYNLNQFDKIWFQLYLSDDNAGNITCKITGREGVYQ